MSLTRQSTDTDTTYLITFTRIGRNHNVAPLLARVRDADHLAEVIHTYARPFLLSGDIEIVVNLDKQLGLIVSGFQSGGSFTVTAQFTPVQLLLAAADVVARGPERDYYENAAREHERNGSVCPGGGNCWFETQARLQLVAAGKPVSS